MTVTPLGTIFIGLTVLAVVASRPQWIQFALAASMPFVQSAAVIVGQSRIIPFYVVAFGAVWLLIVGQRPQRRRPHSQWRLDRLLRVIDAWFIGSAFVLPHLFQGMQILVPRDGIDEQVTSPGSLSFSVSNLAQSLYVLLSVATVIFLMRQRPAVTHLAAVGFGLGTVINTWSLLASASGAPFPNSFFRQAVAGQARYQSSFAGHVRFRGIYAEPSYLAIFAIGALFYAIFLVGQVQTHRAKMLACVLAGANLAALLYSYSGTAIAGLGISVIAVGIVQLARFSAGFKVKPGVVAGFLIALVVGELLFGTRLENYVSRLVAGKLTGSSFGNRSDANAFSWHVAWKTGMLGSGLGSNRPSSFFLLLLSTVGIVGTLLFGVLLVRCIRCGLAMDRRVPDAFALLAVVMAKVVSEPNLAQPVMWLCIGTCVAGLDAMPISPTRSQGAQFIRVTGRQSA